MNGQIIQGDCIAEMSRIPPCSVDLVFGSPPYEDCRTYGINFHLKGQDWVDWMVRVYRESLRVCKGLVAFVVCGKTRKFKYSCTPELLVADLHRAGVTVRRSRIFHRVGIPGSGGPDDLRNDYEFIVCATNGGRLPWSDNTAMGHTPKWAPGGEMSYRQSNGTRRNKWGKSPKQVAGTSGNRNADGSRDDLVRPGDDEPIPIGSVPPGDAYIPPAIANPGNVIHCIVGGGHMGSPLAHDNEAPFPEKLVEWFIRSWCPPGGTVLDPFGGSGTTGAVAEQLGRNWIMIDNRQSQVALMHQRIEETRKKGAAIL